MKSLRIEIYSVAFVLVWSSGYVFGALATQVIAPLAITMWRFLVAAIVLAAIAVARREQWPRRRELATLAAIGIPMFAIQFGALYTALAAGMPASTTSLIACSSPLLVAVISSAAGWEHLTPLRWAGSDWASPAWRRPSPTGWAGPQRRRVAWTLLGLAALAGGTALQSRVKTSAGPAAVASVEVAAGFVVLAGWAPLRGSLTIPLTFHALGAFAWVSLVAGVGGPLLLFSLVRSIGATRASSLLFAVPAITSIAAWPILGIRLGALTGVGLAIVGVALRLGRSGPPVRAVRVQRCSQRSETGRMGA